MDQNVDKMAKVLTMIELRMLVHRSGVFKRSACTFFQAAS